MGRGFGVTAAISHDVIAPFAAEVERLGYSSFWVNDIPNAEGLSSLEVAAGATRSIKLGVGVIPLDTKPPDVIVERVRSLQLPLDRLVLGVGSGHSPQPLARVRDGLTRLRSALGATIVVGALGPKMAALAGQSDGVLLNWMTPEYIEQIARTVRVGAGGSRSTPLLMAYVRTGLSPEADARLGQELGYYSGVASFEQHVERMGVGARSACVMGPDKGSLQTGLAPFERVLDETIVRAITPSDTIDDLVRLAEASAPRPPA
jgi:alkanesulfonate monooxygenase SsuD/methylene tetrahydromethanopterin reductase-like flavin-dependent oxidoreductase (luciferase family)